MRSKFFARRVSFALVVVAISCGSSLPPLGGGPNGQSFDPCGPNPVAGFDPTSSGLTKCCTDGPAHCVPADSVPNLLASYLTTCDDPTQLCMPDTVIEAGASYQPASCTSLGNETGVCLSLCIPMVGQNPMVGLLPQDVCTDGEVCVPCINPLTKMSTGACKLLGPHCGDGGLSPGDDDGGTGGACPYTGPPIVDPNSFAACAPSCGGAHCVPSSLVPAAQQSLLAGCTASDGSAGFCAPDKVIAAGGNYVPPSCRSVAGAEGRCMSSCLPAVAAQASVLPKDTCGDGEVCAPCFNPVAGDPTAPTGACTLACDAPKEPPLVITCPWTGAPLADPSKFPDCSPSCGGAHCVPSALVPAAQQALLATCPGGFCAPDAIIAAGGKILPKSCTSIAGSEGRCLSICLPPVAAQAAQLPKDVCADGEKCAPCYNPTAADPTTPTGACTIGCDAPKEPPLQIMCPYSGPPIVDPASFPACGCGGTHCVPAAQVPAAQQGLLAACSGGFCVPDSVIASVNHAVPPTCTSVAGAEGRCVSTCLPSVAAQANLLPQATCASGTKCAPCYNPTATDPKAPTGACSLGCDKPAKPPTILTCPWTGPDVVNPAAFPPCDNACNGAHCLPKALVPAAQQAMLDTCTGGFCVPDTQIRTGGEGVPKSCTPFAGAPAEGRCLSQCIPMVADKASQLVKDVCGTNEKCVPCYDPFTGDPTGGCTTACDKPTQPPYLFPGCCGGGGTCVPQAQVPSSQASSLQELNCPSQFLCVPDEYLPNPPIPIYGCSTLLFGGGTCVSLCVNLPAGAGIFGQRSCPDNHTCVPCSLAPAGTPGC
jgi:hypothetical protein